MIGRPPITYLNEMRIRYACRLLKETDHSVTEIALESVLRKRRLFSIIIVQIMLRDPPVV
ncbi:hypothetical protein [Marvinbryantia sp.]|uniref:hypothetical protein n=1 Tax=Marvinbryantia sp. TaxID=2496532 RepID=UPI003A93BABB